MAFNVPINSIAPIPTPLDWVRPADWIAITDTPNEVQFLVADTGAKAFAITTTFTRTTGNIYIDWGDGVVDTISTTSSTTTSHVYSTGGTPCSRGYNTFKIRLYGDATCIITNARHIPDVSATGGNPYYNIGLLEAYFGDGTCSTSALFSNYFTSNQTVVGYGSFLLLEYVKLPITVSWTSQMISMFTGCSNLYKVIMPNSASSLTSLSQVFSACTNLLDMAIPSDSTGIVNMQTSFANCTNLREISFPTSLNACTTFSSTFTGCYSLKNVTVPSINSSLTLLSMFVNCYSLQWVKFISLPAPVSPSTTVVFSSVFQNCYNLQNVYFPTSCSGNAIYTSSSIFTGCRSLKKIIFPTNFSASTLNSAFNSCYSITDITFQS